MHFSFCSFFMLTYSKLTQIIQIASTIATNDIYMTNEHCSGIYAIYDINTSQEIIYTQYTTLKMLRSWWRSCSSAWRRAGRRGWRRSRYFVLLRILLAISMYGYHHYFVLLLVVALLYLLSPAPCFPPTKTNTT